MGRRRSNANPVLITLHLNISGLQRLFTPAHTRSPCSAMSPSTISLDTAVVAPDAETHAAPAAAPPAKAPEGTVPDEKLEKLERPVPKKVVKKPVDRPVVQKKVVKKPVEEDTDEGF